MLLNKKKNLNSLILKDRLNGNQLFLHKFSGFSTNSLSLSTKMHIAHALFSVFAIMIIFYIFIVVATVLNIIDKKHTISDINNLNTLIAKTENKYNVEISNINTEMIAKLGFVKSEESVFAQKKDSKAISFLFTR